ncbi:MAG: FkbM family methyltransferase [Acidobacteria bacterium]|nr:FkbM family methyltransferase [Acidobacteriota bacterium]
MNGNRPRRHKKGDELGANSAIRKAAKTLLYPLANERAYKYVQAVSKAIDIRRGTWSEPELDLLGLALREGDTALDIGANYGVYAYHMSRAVGKSGKVFSFEPVPFTFDTLKIISRLLGFSHNVELVEKGCSDENGLISFSVPVQQSGAFAAGQAYIGTRNDEHSGKEDQVKWQSTKEVEAEVVRLDDFLPPLSDLPFVKADIEGAELLCLRGAENLITKHLPTVVCEINPWFLDGFGIKMNELTSFFMDKGYKIYFYEEKRKSLREVDLAEIVEDNYVFLHPSRVERFASLLS